jgi:hypothetical protein
MAAQHSKHWDKYGVRTSLDAGDELAGDPTIDQTGQRVVDRRGKSEAAHCQQRGAHCFNQRHAGKVWGIASAAFAILFSFGPKMLTAKGTRRALQPLWSVSSYG